MARIKLSFDMVFPTIIVGVMVLFTVYRVEKMEQHYEAEYHKLYRPMLKEPVYFKKPKQFFI